VLSATEAITKQLISGLQHEVLADLSASMMRYAKEFGVENLAGLTLKGNGVLKIDQGGTSTTFTKLAPGERLRMRIAAALAVIDVARHQGYGRHPGLLVLDSPGAQEMSDDDFGVLLGCVQEAVQKTEGIQILVGAVTRPELERQVPPNRRRAHAHGEDFLF
jgi:hypothetical protein